MALLVARTRGLFGALVLACAISLAALAATAQAAGPSAGAPPAISGKAVDGKRLKAGTGSWSPKPSSLTYAWERCNAGGSACAPIEGATANKYLASSADVGHRLVVTVTAQDGEGSTQATSAPTAAVAAAPPKHKGAVPAISGNLQDGQVVTATSGGWKGTTPMSFAYQWLSCMGSSCTPIAGATGASYRPDTHQLGHKLRVQVTAANGGGSASKTSKKSAAVEPGPPVNTAQPKVAGLPVVEQKLTAEPGTWAGTGPFTYSYQWRGCNLAGECTDISGAHEPTYTVGPLQIANSIEVVVTAHGALGSVSSTSEPTNLISALLPKNLGLPSILGLLQDGGLLSALTGSWEGSEPLEFGYAWELCNAAGLECEQLKGLLAPTLGLLSSAVGKTVRVIVTATNSAGSTSATSEPTSIVKALLPSNTGLPSITGLLEDGGLLSALTGSWAGTGPLDFSYVWERCNAAGAACAPIEGAVDSTFSLVSGFVGETVRLAVTATNGAGSSTATSEPTSLIGALLPSNLKLPSITGLLQDGSSLTGLLGSWSGTEPAFAYQWQHCNTSGGECEDIKGATGATLGLVESLVGGTVRLLVSATNSAGTTTAASQPTALIKALLPSNSGLPSITGLLQDGSSLTGLLGSWSGTGPLSYGYQWLLCDAGGGSCKEVSGASGSTLGLLTGMIGSTVRLAVTATNSAGSTTATSEPTSLVKALLPSNTGLPGIVGSLIDGSLLSAGHGSWSGSEPLSYAYQWLTCDASGGSCKEVSGANGSTLGLLTSMIGGTARVVVTATNAAGSVSSTSPATGLIKALLPSNTGLPGIAGSLIDGSTLTGGKGSWTGSEPSFSYQWLLCNAGGASCKEVSGATGSTLGLLTGMIGSTVRLAVTATNSAGSTTATSEPTSLVKALLPSNTGLPSIGGLLEDGQTLTGGKGTWNGSEPSFSYQWLLCNLSGGSCKEVSGATGSTLGLLTSMIGSTVRLAVTATNSAGSTTATSEPSSAILAILPKALSLPSISGLAEDGQTLTGAKGSWEGSEPSFSYLWKSCNAAGAECKEVSKATATTFGLTESLIGHTLRLAVTATNSRGSTTAESPATSSVLAILPFKSAAPSIAGILQVGKILEVLPNGEWGGSEKPKAKWQWQTCGLLGKESECVNLAEAVQKTLKLELLWVGLTVRVVESATNSRGTVTKASPITSTILGLLLTPNQGATEGGTAVKLAAPGVSKASAVKFGPTKTTAIQVDSPNEITVTSPAGTEGTVPVTVSTPEGTTHETPETQFTYTGG